LCASFQAKAAAAADLSLPIKTEASKQTLKLMAIKAGRKFRKFLLHFFPSLLFCHFHQQFLVDARCDDDDDVVGGWQGEKHSQLSGVSHDDNPE